MKNVLLLMALLTSIGMRAQISFEATPNFGRLQDITYDPLTKNKLYAVSNSGNHILVSRNNKAAWELLYSFPNPEAQISQLRLLPGSQAMSFIISNTSGHIQDGVYIYNLNSHTISNYYPIPNLEDNPRIMSYDIYEASGTHVLIHDTYTDQLIGGPRTKVFYSSNSGLSMEEIYFSEDFDTVHVNNVAICPTNPNKLFIARSFSPGDIDGGLLISEDAGNTWVETLEGTLLSPIAFNPADSNTIIIGTGITAGYHPENLYRSTDGGVTWAIIPNDWHDIPGFNNINKIAFNPLDPDNIIVLEEDVVAVTNDAGQTWTNTVYVQGNDNSYYAGQNVSFNPFLDGEVIISSPYYPQFSTDGGITFSQLEVPFYNIHSVSSAIYGTENHIYYGAQGGRVHKNLASGFANDTEILNSFEFSPPKHYVIADPLVPGRMFSFAGGGFMGGSFNINTDYDTNPFTLMMIQADDIRALAIDPDNSETVFVAFRNGEGSRLFKIGFSDINDIQNTEIITPGLNIDGLGNGVVSGIAISPNNSQTLYITQRNKFYKSTDGGINWEEKSNGITLDPNNIIWDMAINPFNENEFTIATDNGVFITTDSGENWTNTYDSGATHKVKYSPFAPGLIAIGIKRYGALLYSTDNGLDWTTIDSEQLDYLAAQSIDFTFEGDSINAFIATLDLGVVKYQIQDIHLGIENPDANENSIRIYPNPASSLVNVTLGNDTNQIDSIRVFTADGKKIVTTKQTSFDVSGWSSGIYFIEVNANGKSCIKKVVKN